jgi:hypothetical protein
MTAVVVEARRTFVPLSQPAGVTARVARWFYFKPKIQFLVHFGGP